MPVQTKRVQVDGEEYELTQLGALEGRRLYARMVRLLGPVAAALGRSDKLLEQSLGDAVAAAVEGMDEDLVATLCDTFGKRCRVKAGPDRWPELTGVVFDDHFAGRYLLMTKWLKECLAFNFADFLGGLPPGLLGAIQGATRSASGQTTGRGSTGTSSGSSPPST